MAEAAVKPPLWLLAELTYACPLQCAYCSNPLDYPGHGPELSTDEWKRVLDEARELGALQLGLSGGEPLVRKDLEEIVAHARGLGYYVNLITSGLGMDAARVQGLRAAGVDHIQISFQGSNAQFNDFVAGTRAYAHKREMAQAVKAAGLPMVLCFVIWRDNIDELESMLQLAAELGADYVELATVQYYGWALENRDRLLPTLTQVRRAERVAQAWQQKPDSKMKVYFVVPDYYEQRPKPCMNGWGAVFLTVAPDGTALPCHAARQLPGLQFPNVRDGGVRGAWFDSPGFNRFRGDDWMQEPCRSCDERHRDFGGCRCQAFQFLGDAAATDPVCAKSPKRGVVDAAIVVAELTPAEQPLLFRKPQNARTRV